MKQLLISLFLLFAAVSGAGAQTTPQQLQKFLNVPLQTPDEVALQLREYLMGRVTNLQMPSSAELWTVKEEELRAHLLHVIFHGWPKEWVNSPPTFEDVGEVPGGAGYRMLKLRYEIVPGFWSTAILYEPDHLKGKVPAILNVNGHDYKLGKASEFKQKRCINFAKRGIIALSLEWLSCGELSRPGDRKYGNPHWNAAYLDFVGANAVGLFYLAMRRGLDYLYDLPAVDRSRIGMTGLSGGGWQTITLSALDPRVSVAVPVAGYASLISEIERPDDTGDMEQIPTDFFDGLDNTHLTAMRAPWPTLLIFNDSDDCCFRAPLVKPYVYNEVLPVFKLYRKGDDFQWYDNQDPGTHNYQLDNRLQAYRFFSKYFHLSSITSEIPVGSELKSYQELSVGLPKDNLTFLGLARELAAKIHRQPIPQEPAARTEWAIRERPRLKKVVRYSPVVLKHPWAVNGFKVMRAGVNSCNYTESDLPLASFKANGIEVKSYRFEFNNDLSATGVLIKSLEAPKRAPVTLVLNDEGKRAAATDVSDHVNRGEKVLAADLIFTGDAAPSKAYSQPEGFIQLLATTGDRALGIEVAQLLAIAHWAAQLSGSGKIHLECTGIRSQVAGMIAAALAPHLFQDVVIHGGIRSFSYILLKPVPHITAPDLFCLDLYKDFDLDRIATLSRPTKVCRPQ